MMSEFRCKFYPRLNHGDPFVSEIVGSLSAAKGQFSLIANYTLHLHELNLMPDYSNYGVIEHRFDGETLWEEVDMDDL